jgi:hypothetical protein
MPGQPIAVVEGFTVIVDGFDAWPPACVLATACKEAPHPLRNAKILPVDASAQSTVFLDH